MDGQRNSCPGKSHLSVARQPHQTAVPCTWERRMPPPLPQNKSSQVLHSHAQVVTAGHLKCGHPGSAGCGVHRVLFASCVGCTSLHWARAGTPCPRPLACGPTGSLYGHTRPDWGSRQQVHPDHCHHEGASGPSALTFKRSVSSRMCRSHRGEMVPKQTCPFGPVRLCGCVWGMSRHAVCLSRSLSCAGPLAVPGVSCLSSASRPPPHTALTLASCPCFPPRTTRPNYCWPSWRAGTTVRTPSESSTT